MDDEKEECAHVYTHPPDTQVVTFTGAIDVELNAALLSITPAAGVEFIDPDDVGLEIVIDGAGTNGEPHVTTIDTVNSNSEAVLTDAAIESVTNARVRWRLQNLEMKTTHGGNPGVNDALKAADHSHLGSNISDPLWDKPNGWVAIGSRNHITFPMGFWSRPDDIWIPMNLIEPAKVYYFIARIARASANIKPKGFLIAQLYDSSAGKRLAIEGGRFNLAAANVGTPTATSSSVYKVIARTDRGETLESSLVTINRPANGSFVTNSIYTLLRWMWVPGVRKYEVWRRTGGVFERLTTITNGQTIYADQGAVEATGSGFPQADSQRPSATASSRPNDLSNLAVNGTGPWYFVRLPIFVPSTYDTRATTRQWLRVFLSDEPDREFYDAATTAASVTVTSATAAFADPEDVGREVILTSGSNTYTSTIAAVNSPGEIALEGLVPFTSVDATIRIVGGGYRGILLSEFGLSLTPGGWAANHDDTMTAQTQASNPNGSPIGSSNPVEAPGGTIGGGGVGGRFEDPTLIIE